MNLREIEILAVKVAKCLRTRPKEASRVILINYGAKNRSKKMFKNGFLGAGTFLAAKKISDNELQAILKLEEELSDEAVKRVNARINKSLKPKYHGESSWNGLPKE